MRTRIVNFNIEVLRPLLDAQPRHREMLIGTGGNMAVCTACAATDNKIMIDPIKHKKNCSLRAYYKAYEALRRMLIRPVELPEHKTHLNRPGPRRGQQ